jgi:hypothetical protein
MRAMWRVLEELSDTIRQSALIHQLLLKQVEVFTILSI